MTGLGLAPFHRRVVVAGRLDASSCAGRYYPGPMRHDDGPGPPAAPDVLEFGGRPAGPRRWSRRVALVAALAVAAGIIGYRLVPAAPAPAPSPPAGAAVPTTPASVDPAPQRSAVGHGLMAVPAGWELFGWGPGGVVRIELARGVVTRTPVPPLDSTGPVSFLVGRDWAMVRPLDRVPGYRVPDGQPALPLAGPFSHGGPVLPGPGGDTVWVSHDESQDVSMVLVDGRTGTPTGPAVPVPAEVGADVVPDGTGYLLLRGTGGTYLARPDGRQRVTTGQLLATGPTRWLVAECDSPAACGTVVVDRATGARRALPGYDHPPVQGLGVVSPQGGLAAVQETDVAGQTGLHLVDLATGTDRRLEVPIDQPVDPATVVWSPDGRWLFVAGVDGTLFVVAAATAQVSALEPTLPPVRRLALR